MLKIPEEVLEIIKGIIPYQEKVEEESPNYIYIESPDYVYDEDDEGKESNTIIQIDL